MYGIENDPPIKHGTWNWKKEQSERTTRKLIEGENGISRVNVLLMF